jgi:hypothetical protein
MGRRPIKASGGVDRVELVEASAASSELNIVVIHGVRVKEAVPFRDTVTPSPRPEVIEGGPEPQRIDNLLDKAADFTALTKIIGVGDKDGPAGDPKHFPNGLGWLRDMM